MASNNMIVGLPAPRRKQDRRTFTGAALDVHACAGLLGTSPRAIRGLIAKRIIPHRRLAGRIIFIRSEVETWLAYLDGCTLAEAEQNLALRRGDR
jgi:hypothetical protein